jgi:hypothetical protein
MGRHFLLHGVERWAIHEQEIRPQLGEDEGGGLADAAGRTGDHRAFAAHVEGDGKRNSKGLGSELIGVSSGCAQSATVHPLEETR